MQSSAESVSGMYMATCNNNNQKGVINSRGSKGRNGWRGRTSGVRVNGKNDLILF